MRGVRDGDPKREIGYVAIPEATYGLTAFHIACLFAQDSRTSLQRELQVDALLQLSDTIQSWSSPILPIVVMG